LGIKVEEIISSANSVCQEQLMLIINNELDYKDKFGYIIKIIDTFYAHRKLFNSLRHADINE